MQAGTNEATAGASAEGSAGKTGAIRLGAVSYLNTLPLIEGLGKLRDVQLTLTAPARLVDLLLGGSVDLALASVIDAQRADRPVALVPAGMIGCDGATLTVRLFSRVPAGEVRVVHADVDSHTSVALLRVLLAERYGVRPDLRAFDLDAHRATREAAWPEALLLIGDKVITDAPPAALYPHQLDLGREWKELTGLPFVYAAWMCRAEEAGSEAVRTGAAILDRQRRHNATRLDWIVAARAPSRGWPVADARRYVGELLRYEVTEEHRRSVDVFFAKAAACGVISGARRVCWAG
ncbi:MAG: menaquinone biosynthesis protein [Planctomycetota bacterium]|nr:menaquinone biosynthesis protein [Planctomycetota bacterium]